MGFSCHQMFFLFFKVEATTLELYFFAYFTKHVKDITEMNHRDRQGLNNPASMLRIIKLLQTQPALLYQNSRQKLFLSQIFESLYQMTNRGNSPHVGLVFDEGAL